LTANRRRWSSLSRVRFLPTSERGQQRLPEIGDLRVAQLAVGSALEARLNILTRRARLAARLWEKAKWLSIGKAKDAKVTAVGRKDCLNLLTVGKVNE